MTRYQVSLWAQDIKYGWFRKPNCYAVLEDKDGTEVGRTDTLEACRDPDWIKILFIEANSDQFTPFTVKVYHDRPYDPVLLGKAVFEATEVNQANGHMETKNMDDGRGKISMSVVESNPKVMGSATLHFRGLDIRNVEVGALGLGRSDPFFEISKKTVQPLIGVSRWNAVYRSEPIQDHLNPFWEPLDLGLEELCDGDLDSRLRISVFDAKKGAHKLIGSIEASLNQLQERVGVRGNADRDMAFELALEDSGRGTKGTGLFCVMKCDINIGQS
jgi:hypothetical protein